MNETITVGGVKYTAANVATGLNSILFMLPELTEDEDISNSLAAEEKFESIIKRYPKLTAEEVEEIKKEIMRSKP